MHADNVFAIISDSSLPSIAEGVGRVTVGLLTLFVGGCEYLRKNERKKNKITRD